MATAAPHVKLLRQLASAKDDYLSGAFDISWDGAKATLYLVFGRPSHAVFDTDQAQIEGEAAIDALLAELPRTFAVSDWRRAMSPQETLSITIDELAGPFVRLAGSYADDPVTEESPEWWSAEDSSPDLAFGLADFPLLPGGRPLWAETSPENVNLAERLAELPPSILILTGAKLRAAAVVSGGDLIDAVWIDAEDQARGESAAMAILGATKGSLAGYALDDPRVADALTMLWRLPLAVSGIEMAWLDPASMLAAFRADGLDRVLIIDAPVRGIALFSRGGLVAVYSETQRSAVASPERLRSLLSQAKGRLTVMERKPRPTAADRGDARQSASEFFAVIAPDPAPDDTEAAEPAAAAVHLDVAAEPVAEDEVAATPASLSWYHPGSAPDSAATTVAEPAGATDAAAPEAGAPSDNAVIADDVAAQNDAGTATAEPSEAPATWEHPAGGETSAWDAPSASTAPADAVTSDAPTELTEAPFGSDASPPPPPPDHDPTSAVHDAPPPPPELPVHADAKPKRRWRLFGGRRNRATAADTQAAAELAAQQAAQEAAEAASFAGWSVRQQSPEPQPVWARSKVQDDAPAATGEEPPSRADDVQASAPATTWSVVERGAPDEPETAPATDDEEPVSTASEGEPEASNDTATEPEASSGTAIEPEANSDTAIEPEASSDTAIEHTDLNSETSHEPAAADAPEPDAEQVETPASELGDEPAAAVSSESEDAPAALESGDEPAEDASEPEHEPDETVAAETGHEVAHDFWADFATPDPDAEPEVQPAHDTGATETPDDSEHDQAPEADAEPAAHDDAETQPAPAADAEPAKRPSSGRTVAPWSWPLAEAEVPVETGSGRGGLPPRSDEPTPVATGARSEADSSAEEASVGDQAFFQRDEPVGSQFVDFDEVRNELVQIGVLWLGESSATPVTALLLKTRSTIDDFVATIDTIRGLHVEGQDPASIQAMAREMHQQAAERLCGA